VADQTITEQTALVVDHGATDSDLPANSVAYVLVEAPAGAAIDNEGIIRWTPNEAQGPRTNVFVTIVTDNGVPPLSSTNSLRSS